MFRTAFVLLLAVLSLGACATTDAQSSRGVVGAEQYFRLQWQAEESRGEPVVAGYLYNDHRLPATNVRLLVEGFDDRGKQVSRTTAYVLGDVPSGGRASFEVTTPRASTYRVTVFWWEWREGGGA